MAAALSQNGFHALLKLGQQHSRHKCLYCSAKTLPPERTLRINMDGGEYDLNEIVRFLEA